MPLAWTSKWRQGPSIRVSAGSGAATYQPEGSVGVVSGLVSGLVIARAPALSWPGVSAVRVSLTDSIVPKTPKPQIIKIHEFRNICGNVIIFN